MVKNFTETVLCNSRKICQTCLSSPQWRGLIGAPDICPHGVTPDSIPPKPPRNLFGPGSTDHEIKAAQAGYVPSCCGSAANTKLQS